MEQPINDREQRPMILHAAQDFIVVMIPLDLLSRAGFFVYVKINSELSGFMFVLKLPMRML